MNTNLLQKNKRSMKLCIKVFLEMVVVAIKMNHLNGLMVFLYQRN